MPRNTSSNTRASVAKKTQPKTTAKSDEPNITYESNNDAKSDAEQPVVSKPVYTVKEEPLDPNMFVPVRNGFNGKLIYISRKTGERFVWQKFGDEQDMELRELRAAKTSYKSFFENNWFLIDDPAVISYLGVDRFYENALRYVDWTQKTVKIFGRGGKYRTSYLNAKAQVALQDYLDSREDDSEYLIVSERKPYGKMSRYGIEHIVGEISNRAFYLTGKRFTPHVFRHTTATTALQNGMPIHNISRMLGHSQIETTMIYAETNLADVQRDHMRYVV